MEYSRLEVYTLVVALKLADLNENWNDWTIFCKILQYI
jgi:hypothetical protein